MQALTNVFKYHKIPLLFITLSSIFYLSFAYDLVRTDVTKLVLLYVALFVFGFQIIKISGFRLLAISAILFRVLFLFAIPNLSQDFYRFIWDGQMIMIGFNPYLSTPDFQMEMGLLSGFPNQVELYNGMGALSASHYTNYPPLKQLCFVIGNLFPGHSILSSVIGMRLLIIAADIGTLYFGKKLLDRLKLPSKRIFWYILNPFIIIELTGNLHFEGVMIFFLVWSLYLLHARKWKWAAVVLACSISVKLIPLMFLPLFFGWFTSTTLSERKEKRNLFKLILFYTFIVGTVLLFFLPFFSMEFVNNYAKTVGLWFGNFEFNASIYYLARAIGYAITGYNEIAVIGKVLPAITVLIILGLAFFKRNNSLPNLITSMVLVFSCYLFLSTTVHPWYIAPLVLFGVFTNYKFPLVWSLVVILSYLAYSNTDNSENLWIIALEYGVVLSFFIWEVFIKKRLPVTQQSNVII
ncbi:glycosyltransferase 87 family protein [Winogradskyella forsetii]|uniref:glycosyltransferase 87 family protein n=1 Tax=Winogradskyella forsetii TaxID=2686077 RepID=UPI0015BEA9D0|nr:glycosyltransferase 87 family protein [Winogradskyella forsetii]